MARAIYSSAPLSGAAALPCIFFMLKKLEVATDLHSEDQKGGLSIHESAFWSWGVESL
jgi:hypothetical protein